MYFQDIKMLSLTQTTINLVSVLLLWTVAFEFCCASPLIQLRCILLIFASKYFSMSPLAYLSSDFKNTVLFFSFLAYQLKSFLQKYSTPEGLRSQGSLATLYPLGRVDNEST